MAAGRMTFPPMRPQLEIQRLHDLLMNVLSDRRLTQAVLPAEYGPSVAMVADCLCWILHHDVDVHHDSHASDFAAFLKDLQGSLDEVGFVQDAPPDSEYIIEE